jgi:hypothetical protein
MIMRRIDGLLRLLAAVLVTTSVAAQVPDANLSDAPFTILQGSEGPALAASITCGLYPAGVGTARIGNTGFDRPEALAAAFYQQMRAGNKSGVVALFDDSSKVSAERKINIASAVDAYSRIRDIELFSKAVFGDAARIRFELLRGGDSTFPWVLETRKFGGRYYITETLQPTNLFVELASAHPYNLDRKPFTPAQTAGLISFGFQQAGSGIRRTGASGGTGGITLYMRLSSLADQGSRDAAAGALALIEGMRTALKDNDEGKFLALWDPAEQSRLKTAENYKVVFMSQQHFYSEVDTLVSVGYVKAGAELVLFYYPVVDGRRLDLQVLPMRQIGGRYYLIAHLDEFAAWQIFNNLDVRRAIAESLPQQ